MPELSGGGNVAVTCQWREAVVVRGCVSPVSQEKKPEKDKDFSFC